MLHAGCKQARQSARVRVWTERASVQARLLHGCTVGALKGVPVGKRPVPRRSLGHVHAAADDLARGAHPAGIREVVRQRARGRTVRRRRLDACDAQRADRRVGNARALSARPVVRADAVCVGVCYHALGARSRVDSLRRARCRERTLVAVGAAPGIIHGRRARICLSRVARLHRVVERRVHAVDALAHPIGVGDCVGRLGRGHKLRLVPHARRVDAGRLRQPEPDRVGQVGGGKALAKVGQLLHAVGIQLRRLGTREVAGRCGGCIRRRDARAAPLTLVGAAGQVGT
eukprot:351509-Chlamydomonas_euryale.AAC.8